MPAVIAAPNTTAVRPGPPKTLPLYWDFGSILCCLTVLFLVLHARSLVGAEPSPLAQPPMNGSKDSLGSYDALPRLIIPGGTNIALVANTNGVEALDDKHQLAIGDKLSFRILEDEDEPKALFVTDSGDLEIPYIGRFQAAGKTCGQLARELKTELEKEYYYHATVIVAVDVMTKSRGKVYLVGPVHIPGPQEIPSDEVFTLSKAILRAGGFGDYAERHKVRVTRKASGPGGKDRVFTVNVAEILEKGKTESDLQLEPGDLIYIPERLIRF